MKLVKGSEEVTRIFFDDTAGNPRLTILVMINFLLFYGERGSQLELQACWCKEKARGPLGRKRSDENLGHWATGE